MPPADALRAVFSGEVLRYLHETPNPTSHLSERLSILTACGPYPLDPDIAQRLRWLRSRRAAWEAYLTAAFASGLLDGAHGCDVRARLTGRDDDNFRSALAECLVCWFIAAKLKLPVAPWPAGRPGKVPDLLVNPGEDEITIEVKAPYVPPPNGRAWWGDCAAELAECIDSANAQFEQGRRNVLAIVPKLRDSVYHARYQLIRAFYGEHKFMVPLSRDTTTDFAARTRFFPEGKFLKRWPEPRFTRTSAVLCLEEYDEEFGENTAFYRIWTEHRCLLLHNPHSSQPIQRDLCPCCPQFVKVQDTMIWTDGKPII